MAMPITHRRFTVDEYHRMAEAGILTEDDRVELLDGEIVAMTPIGSRHAGCVNRLNRLFARVPGDAVLVSIQNPVILNQYWEPEPDVAVLRFRSDGYATAHPRPRDVLLLVEVADSSTQTDRQVKLAGYAAAGIPEVWIVDLTSDAIEVYREPEGEHYADRQILGREAPLTALNVPEMSVRVSDVLGSVPR